MNRIEKNALIVLAWDAAPSIFLVSETSYTGPNTYVHLKNLGPWIRISWFLSDTELVAIPPLRFILRSQEMKVVGECCPIAISATNVLMTVSKPNPYDFQLIPEWEPEDTQEIEFNLCEHEASKDPLQLPEKHFEWWHICKKCGDALEPFKGNGDD